ncbi:MAG: Bro-N domain-containing protein [Bacteroidales bacterium]
MNNLKIFENKEFGEVRVRQKDGEFWFVAKDICEALEISKYRDAVNRLDRDERGSLLVDTPGGAQEMTAINEPGMYSLVLRSRKPEAKKFKRWVTHDVLPQLRKTGTYSIEDVPGKQFALETSKLLMPVMEDLNLSPESKMTALKHIYDEAGIKLPIHVQLSDNLLTATDIAKKIGVFSKNGNPHNQAVGAIINELEIKPNEVCVTMGENEKHQYSQKQYYPSVLEKVRGWLQIKGKPNRIETERGNYNVKYL